jgi:periplasmic protein TonB
MRLVLIACVLAAAACAPRREAPPPRPIAPPVVQAPAAAPAPAPGDLEGYKRQFALDLIQATPRLAYCPPGEAILKSVVVLQITVDPAGELLGASVFRSNGYVELERRALDTVRRAAPFPAPAAGLTKERGSVYFLETFLFNHDDCFQIRSLVF